MYLTGHGTVKNVEQGFSLIREVADGNNAVGLRLLGLTYQNGLGVTQDYAKARWCYERAISLGDSNAYQRLAMLYLFGLGLQQDRRKAIELLKRGSAMGDEWSQVNLARVYEVGTTLESPQGESDSLPLHTTVNSEYALARQYYGQAAAVGNSFAAFHLGQMYESGRGVHEDYTLALRYYQLAAARGLPEAQMALAELYEKGLGTGADYAQAYAYYSLASRRGNATASQHLQILSRVITTEQKQQGETVLSQILQRRTPVQQVP
jgi:TPR repeat protein